MGRAARAPAEAEAGTRARTAAVAAPGGGGDPPARLGALRAPRAPLGCARGGRAGGEPPGKRGSRGVEASLRRRGTPRPRCPPAAPLPLLPASRPPGLPGRPRPRERRRGSCTLTARAAAAPARPPASSERSPPRPSPRSRHARAPSACPQRRGGR